MSKVVRWESIIVDEKKIWVPGTLPLKFGQNLVSNSWDNPDMKKSRQDISYLDNCHHDSWHLLKIVPGTCI